MMSFIKYLPVAFVLAVCTGAPTVAQADYDAGLKAYEQGNYRRALKKFTTDSDDFRANLAAGQMYERGQGAEKDIDLAADQYGRAHENAHEKGLEDIKARALERIQTFMDDGNFTAVAEMGNVLLRRNEPGDEEAAFKLHQTATEAGNPPGMVYLAQDYLDGRGVAKDKKAAYFWMKAVEKHFGKFWWTEFFVKYFLEPVYITDMPEDEKLEVERAAQTWVPKN